MDKANYFNSTRPQRSSTGSTRVSQVMSKAVQSYDAPTIKNPHGVKAFEERSHWQELARCLFANLLKGEFYKDSDEVAIAARDIHLWAVKTDPILYLKGLVKSRQMNLKAQPQIGVAIFMAHVPAVNNSGHPGVDWRGYIATSEGVVTTVEDVLVELLSTMAPKQMVGIAEMLRQKTLGGIGLGTAAKRVFSRAMGSWSIKYAEYYAVTYRAEINQLLRMIHPDTQYFSSDAYRVLMAAVDNHGPVTERQKVALDLMSDPDVKMSDDKFGKLLIDWDINWEQTKALKNVQTPRSWFARMMQMSMNALMLNLRSLEEHGVFNFPEGAQYLNEKMKEAGKARILPFDIIRAYKNNTNPVIKNALEEGFAAAFQYKMPEWSGKAAAVFLDVSGSMTLDTLSYGGSLVASLLPSLDQDTVTFASFDTRLIFETDELYTCDNHYNGWYGKRGYLCPRVVGVDPRTIIKKLFRMVAGGGTDTSLGIQCLLSNRIYKDIILMVTDEQQNTGKPMYEVFKEYKRIINPNAMLVIINPTSDHWHNAFQGDPSVITINTVTPTIFKALPQLANAEGIMAGVDLGKYVQDGRSRRAKFSMTDTYVPKFL